MHASWRAGGQVDGYVVRLKLEKLLIRKRKSKKQNIGKIRAFES